MSNPGGIRAWLLAAGLVATCLLGASRTDAGGGPENLALVVNARSWASKTIANYYVQLRGIPRRNVIYLDWDGRLLEGTSIEVFRQKILIPLLNALEAQGIADQIDYVVYSADFPTHIGIRDDLGGQQVPQQLAPMASINGLTFYYQLVLLKNPGYLNIGGDRYSNLYFRRRDSATGQFPSQGFRRWYGWNTDGSLNEAGGISFLLSTVLAVTTGRGNSVSEVRAYLRSSRAADGTHPKGTIYYMDNSDPRSAERKSGRGFPGAPGFADAVEALEKLGVAGTIAPGVYPQRKSDVQGLMMGSEKFDWAKSQSRIQPGAICENLTSFGGVFDDVANQTPLTEFLRYGAAGSSGTVVEPFLILQKFPSPFLQVHYARGCSLAESFYQSVAGPYQLLIVGDALCQPWANIPQVTVAGIGPSSKATGTLVFKPAARVPGDGAVHRFTLYVDGRAQSTCLPGESLSLDTKRFCDGYHDLSVVCTEKSAIETQGRWMGSVLIDNGGNSCKLVATPAGKTITSGEPLKLAVEAPGAAKIAIVHNSREVGTVDGPAGSIDLDTAELGFGPVRFWAIALADDPMRELATSAPLEVNLRPKSPLAPSPTPTTGLKPGILLTHGSGGGKQSISDTSKPDWLQQAGVKPQEEYALTGYVQVPQEDVYQFQIAHLGTAAIRVNNSLVYQGNDPTSWPPHYVPVALKPGQHRVEIQGKAASAPRLELRFGGPGAWRAGAKNFQHE